MDLDQLTGRCQRLKDELSRAYAQEPWPTGRIDRLIGEISAAELAIAAVRAKTAKSDSDSSIDSFATATANAPVAPTGVGKSMARAPSVARNRLTPFGPRAPQAAGD